MGIYGFIMMDAGYNFDQIQADWFDVVQYGDRTFRDGFEIKILKVQISFKYNFSQTFYRN